MLVPFDLVARSGAESSGDRSAPNTHGNTSKGGGHEFGHNGEQPAGEDTADSISDTSTEHPRCHPTRSNQVANRVASVLQLDDGQQSQHTRPRPQYHRANPGITQGPSHGGHQESFNLQMNILMNQHHISVELPDEAAREVSHIYLNLSDEEPGVQDTIIATRKTENSDRVPQPIAGMARTDGTTFGNIQRTEPRTEQHAPRHLKFHTIAYLRPETLGWRTSSTAPGTSPERQQQKRGQTVPTQRPTSQQTCRSSGVPGKSTHRSRRTR